MIDISCAGDVVDEIKLSDKTGITLSQLIALKNVDIIPTNWRYNEKMIKQQSAIRKIKAVAQSVVEDQSDCPDNLVQLMQETINEFQVQNEQFEITAIQNTLADALVAIEKRIEAKGQIAGISSGLKELDKYIGGFQNRRLYYIGARPSQGKTALLINFMINCKLRCGFLSAESGKQEIVNRILSNQSNIDSQRLVFGLLKTGEINHLYSAIDTLQSREEIFIYDEPNMSIETAVFKAKEMKRKFDIQILFVDYLQIISSSSTKSNQQDYREHVANVSRQMKQLARILNIPVVVAAQLRRDAEGIRPKLNDFSESTQIERDADVAIMIHNRYEDGALKDTWLIVEKNRDGRKGDVPVIFDQNHLRFIDQS
jgi:replicative DNA helicase